MFDAIPSAVFWPAFVIAWVAVSWFVLWLFAKVVDGANPERRFEQRDRVAERRRSLERNGSKSRIGAR